MSIFRLASCIKHCRQRLTISCAEVYNWNNLLDPITRREQTKRTFDAHRKEEPKNFPIPHHTPPIRWEKNGAFRLSKKEIVIRYVLRTPHRKTNNAFAVAGAIKLPDQNLL